MPDRDPRPPEERPSATGAWQPPVGGPGDPPTVRSDLGVAATGSGDRSGTPRPGSLPLLPHLGDRLGVFVLEAAIGAGGMGAVFRAHDEQLDRTVALKILPPEQANDVESVGRFYQEGRAAARLDHENIARAYTISYSAPYHFIAFEFIEGTTLRQRVEKGGVLSVGDAINYTLQIAGALVHATERGVVHRDVKPSNIIITPQGRAKLVDMGLARRFERGGDAGLTQTGMTLGTFDYISPEQARDPRDVDVRSDLYSLGCTLYYTLAGRPPFPDGTVLQKLLQHQEEPPPDIRAANPSVPADLAAILQKLMAKDRDRRYQTPELLVRDLLSVAGALNLRSLSPEGLVWMGASTPPPAWERHLIWGIPALAFVVIVAFLSYGNPQGEPTPTLNLPPQVTAAPPRSSKAILPPPTTPTKPETVVVPKAETAPRTPARDLIVRATDDLARLLSESAPGTTLLLADDGPYELRPAQAPLTVRNIALRAGIGVQPVLRLARDAVAPAMLDLRGGRLTIEGVEFEVDADERDAPLAAIRAEGVELSLTGCLIRRVGTRPGRGQAIGLQLRAGAGEATTRKTAEVVVDSCHFDGGQSAIQVDGPVELTIRDATISGSRFATIACSNSDPTGLAATLRLNHLSVLLGAGPFLRSTGVPPRVRLNDSAIAPPGEGEGVLAIADDPTRFTWQGRDNIYGQIGVFLQSDRPGLVSGFAPIRMFEAWADDPSTLREAGSIQATWHLWSESDPTLKLTGTSDPSQAFRLALTRGAASRVGARRGPFGVLTATLPSRPTPGNVGEKPNATTPTELARVEPTAKPEDQAQPPPPMPVKPPDAVDDIPPDMPVVVDQRTSPPMPMPMPMPTTVPAPPATPAPASTPPQPAGIAHEFEGKIIRTAAQLLTALAQSGGRGETIRLASDADWEMGSCELKTAGSCTIQAEPGKTRPRIRFRPRAGEPRAASGWNVWLSLVEGSLKVEGIDLVLPADEAPRSGGWAAFAVEPGTDLSLGNCTVTVEGTTTSAVVVAPSSEPKPFGEMEAEPSSTVRLSASFFRTGGDLLDVASDRRVDLQVEDVAAVTGGHLIHGHGRSRGPAEPLKATLRRLAARVEGGLVLLEGTTENSELPQAEIIARDSVFTTDGKETPLIQVDGPGDLDSLRDRVRWDGHGVAYHKVASYRRDQVLRPGMLPTSFDRAAWDLALGRRESSPIHGDIFANEWTAGRPAWQARPEDLRIKADGPAARSGAGPDPLLVPAPHS
jgi:eukaryotic-like serine/threonine-protein kinase